MKRTIMILTALLALSGGVFAQVRERVLFDPDYQAPQTPQTEYVPYYSWQPFDDVMGYSLYGSRYRRAKSNRNWGIFLTTVSAPISAIIATDGLEEGLAGWAVIGAAGLVGSLWGGISLWTRGRRELDWMMDDYARRYAPRPYGAALSVGPTRNGMGLALNF